VSRESSRWTFTGGSRPEGVIVYDGGQKIHVHHDTDVARGQHNAFDLVRLHKYGNLDAGVAPGTPITEMPSFKAMAEFAASLPEVRAAQAAVEFEELPPRTPDEIAMGAKRAAKNPAAQKAAEPPKDPARFKVIAATEFAKGKPLEWIVKGVLPRAGLAVIYGESGSGKSFWALDLVACIQQGVSWRGHKTRKGRGIMVVAEGVGGFRQRLNAYAKQNEVSLSVMPGVIPDAPNLLDLEDTDALINQVLAWGQTDLVVVDTLSATTPGANENAGEDMGKVLSHCQRLHKATEKVWGEGNGAMVVLIHHSGKDASRGARGWSGLKAAADVEI
jgi:RecA/RadA recombinase